MEESQEHNTKDFPLEDQMNVLIMFFDCKFNKF